MRLQLVVAVVMVPIDVQREDAPLVPRLIRFTRPDRAVHPFDLSAAREKQSPRTVFRSSELPGWLGLVRRCSIPFASQIMSKRIGREDAVFRLRGCSAN
nr:hypothetical protein [Rhodovulum visakhapatnamense]